MGSLNLSCPSLEWVVLIFLVLVLIPFIKHVNCIS